MTYGKVYRSYSLYKMPIASYGRVASFRLVAMPAPCLMAVAFDPPKVSCPCGCPTSSWASRSAAWESWGRTAGARGLRCSGLRELSVDAWASLEAARPPPPSPFPARTRGVQMLVAPLRPAAQRVAAAGAEALGGRPWPTSAA